MSNLISREMALEIIDKMMEIYFDRKVILAKAYDQIKDMPSAQKNGRWRDISGQAVLCSVCGRAQNYKQTKGWRYCPHCGSRNEH